MSAVRTISTDDRAGPAQTRHLLASGPGDGGGGELEGCGGEHQLDRFVRPGRVELAVELRVAGGRHPDHRLRPDDPAELEVSVGPADRPVAPADYPDPRLGHGVPLGIDHPPLDRTAWRLPRGRRAVRLAASDRVYWRPESSDGRRAGSS
jgi:hypothetical protein